MVFVTYEHKEGALDTVLQLCRVPSFLMELYLNYDCHLYSENLFERLIEFLGKHACPTERALFTTHLLALNSLLTAVNEIAYRATRPEAVTTATGTTTTSTTTTTTSTAVATVALTDDVALATPTATIEIAAGVSPVLPSALPSAESLIDVKRRKALLLVGSPLSMAMQ